MSEQVLRPAVGDAVTGEYEEKRSRFLAVLHRADDEIAARDLVAGARRAHPEARHHCSAFRLTGPGAQPIERSNDDGEPAGTAGTPILEVLRGAGLTEVAVVVVRWFGGTKLGTGGLARAYSAATAEAVRHARLTGRLVRVVSSPTWVCEVPHTVAGGLESELRARGVQVLSTEYGHTARIRVAGRREVVSPILAARTSGGIEWTEDGTTVHERAVRP